MAIVAATASQPLDPQNEEFDALKERAMVNEQPIRGRFNADRGCGRGTWNLYFLERTRLKRNDVCGGQRTHPPV